MQTPNQFENSVHTSRLAAVAAASAALFLAGCGNNDRVNASPTPEAVAASSAEPAGLQRGVLLEGSEIRQEQQFGADTFADYRNASGKGPALPVGQVVTVDCYVKGPKAAAESAKGLWYHLTGPSQYLGYFAASNTFVNGDAENGPAIDPQVPHCPK